MVITHRRLASAERQNTFTPLSFDEDMAVDTAMAGYDTRRSYDVVVVNIWLSMLKKDITW